MRPCRNLRIAQWSSLMIFAAYLLTVSPMCILAQSTNATCLSSFNWMGNSKNQSPCLLAAYLQGVCNGGQFTVGSLAPGTHYVGPLADQQNPCGCSSVTYNAVSACGFCQNETFISWSIWDFNCSTVYPGFFPFAVPDGTAIPQWAFQDVTTSNVFNVSLAQTVGDNPESTATHIHSTGSLIPTSTSISALASLTAAPTVSSSRSPGSKTNVGVIVGGVVVGVVGAAFIIGIVVFLIVRWKRSQFLSPAEFAGPQMSLPFSSIGYKNPPPALQAYPLKFYDPSDPSTFPDSSTETAIWNGPTANGIHYTTHSVRPDGHYNGMPEI